MIAKDFPFFYKVTFKTIYGTIEHACSATDIEHAIERALSEWPDYELTDVIKVEFVKAR